MAALEETLAANVERPKHDRLTYERIFEELRVAGYRGGYDNMRRCSRSWAEREGKCTTDA